MLQARFLLKENDILVSLTGNVGRVSKMSSVKGVLNQRVAKIIPKTDCAISEYIFHVLRNPIFEKSMIDAGQGAAQKNISNDDILSYKFQMPSCKKEQEKIAIFLDNIDCLIDLHENKLIAYEKTKTALLQALFI